MVQIYNQHILYPQCDKQSKGNSKKKILYPIHWTRCNIGIFFFLHRNSDSLIHSSHCHWSQQNQSSFHHRQMADYRYKCCHLKWQNILHFSHLSIISSFFLQQVAVPPEKHPWLYSRWSQLEKRKQLRGKISAAGLCHVKSVHSGVFWQSSKHCCNWMVLA